MPNGTDWVAETMKNDTLTLITDGLYMIHLNRNMSGAGMDDVEHEDFLTHPRAFGGE